LVDLFARVLHSGVDHVLRLGLDRGYVLHRESIPGLRGKLDLSATLKTAAATRAQAVCEFDDLSHDVLHNRIIKSTIRGLLLNPTLSNEAREPLSETYRRLQQIQVITVTDRAFRSVQLHRNNGAYRFLLEICRIVHEMQIVHETSGDVPFRDFVRDEHRMRRLFERFVRNFYRREQHTYRVCGNKLNWGRTSGSPDDVRFLPQMRTDVRLESKGRTLVVETKFVPQLFQTYYGKDTLRPSHLYQLFAYLRNVSAARAASRPVDGLLLYPTVSVTCDLRYEMHGHHVRVFSVNLAQPWQQIRLDLLRLLD
jgi:5-methylcytosine-specific restriction enzyme subunit McrC